MLCCKVMCIIYLAPLSLCVFYYLYGVCLQNFISYFEIFISKFQLVTHLRIKKSPPPHIYFWYLPVFSERSHHRYRRRKNRLLKFAYVPTTSAAHNRLLFLLRPFTVLMKKTCAIKQSIIFRCLWFPHTQIPNVFTSFLKAFLHTHTHTHTHTFCIYQFFQSIPTLTDFWYLLVFNAFLHTLILNVLTSFFKAFPHTQILFVFTVFTSFVKAFLHTQTFGIYQFFQSVPTHKRTIIARHFNNKFPAYFLQLSKP